MNHQSINNAFYFANALVIASVWSLAMIGFDSWLYQLAIIIIPSGIHALMFIACSFKRLSNVLSHYGELPAFDSRAHLESYRYINGEYYERARRFISWTSSLVSISIGAAIGFILFRLNLPSANIVVGFWVVGSVFAVRWLLSKSIEPALRKLLYPATEHPLDIVRDGVIYVQQKHGVANYLGTLDSENAWLRAVKSNYPMLKQYSNPKPQGSFYIEEGEKVPLHKASVSIEKVAKQ